MSVRSHIAEIFRQGLWASITGGWFFDPRLGLFPNTVHLYLFLILLLVPLILGFTASVALLSWIFIGCYAALVAVAFLSIKGMVWYLHHVFDTHEALPLPVVNENSRNTSFAAAVEGLANRTDITSDPGEPPGDIEMSVLRRSDERTGGATISSSAPGFLDVADIEEVERPKESTTRRSVRILQALPPGPSDLAVTADVHASQPDLKQEEDRSSEDASSGPHSDKALLGQQRIELPVDSLELLPVVRRPSDAESQREPEQSQSGVHRKYSEPSIFPYTSSLRHRNRRSSGGGVRRVHSSLETSAQRSALVLSQQTLEECKLKGTRKSYPSKTSSTDIFLINARPPMQQLLDEQQLSSEESSGLVINLTNDSAADVSRMIREEPERDEQVPYDDSKQEEKAADQEPDQSSDENASILNRRSQLMRSLRQTLDAWRMDAADSAPHTESVSSPELSTSPCRSVTPDLTWLFDEAPHSAPQSPDDNSTDGVHRRDDDEDQDDIVPLPAEKGADGRWASYKKQRPRSYAFSRGQEREPRAGTSSGPNSAEVMDLKEELARLLEEIIETHPEALEAIESVRQRRSRDAIPGLPSDAPQAAAASGSARSSLRQSRNRHPAGSVSRGNSNSNRASESTLLADIAAKSGAHVASTHEDTTQGALHSFQDEDGNWWTYTFDADGIGTAQALGSSKAVLEMISAQQQAVRQQRWPWLGLDLEMDSEMKHEMQSALRRHRRSNSSSSEEDPFGDPFIGGPASILHPASGSQVSREPPLSSLAQRLRSVTRNSTRGSAGSSSDRRHRLQLMMERTLAAAAAATAGQQPGGSVTTPGDYSTATLGISGSVRTSSLGSGSSLNRIRFLTDLTGMSAAGTSVDSHRASMRRKCYYRMTPLPKWITRKSFKLKLDRLSLLSLFDRNMGAVSIVCDSVLASAVTVLACLLIRNNFYHDIKLLVFSVVVAGSQFSLLKSVQPDASSPIHGYNWIVTYSRPAYFCLLASVILTLDAVSHNAFGVVGGDSVGRLVAARDFFVEFVLFLPILFAVGLLPQVNTFAMHWLEQVDMHLLGGTASLSLLSSLYSMAKSLLSVAVLFVMASVGTWAGIEEVHKHVLFSLFCAASVSLSYLLSRSSSNPRLLLCATENFSFGGSKSDTRTEEENSGPVDPLPGRLKDTVTTRLKHDILVSILIAIVTFGIHCSSVFAVLQPYLTYVLIAVASAVGLVNHYLWPQLRKQSPWLVLAQPVLKPHEYTLFETFYPARVMWFERIYAVLSFLERNLLYPLLVISALTWYMGRHEDDWFAPIFLPIVGLKLLRSAWCNASQLYLPLMCAALLFTFDFKDYLRNSVFEFPVSFYLLVAAWPKLRELVLKLQFILAYVAPWQISWGSAFHAFAQPFSVPHSGLTLAQASLSSLLSAPLNPFLGSSFFLLSYVRPVKFWERDYNTRRVDHSNTRLISQIDRGPMTDDSNLNAIFYEHLTRSLQQSLAGDIAMGRWASNVAPGDCFILASFYLNCLVHIVEVGNGFVTFQLRGLEFRGTYCQQREVEAISEDIADSDGCCCCELGHLPGFLSLNTAWTLRWLAWEVTATKYVVEGYSITDNSAVSMLQVHELRRLLVTLYVKCIIYYGMLSPKLEEWLCTDAIIAALEPIIQNKGRYLDVDPMFCVANDEDYDVRLSGVSRESFCQIYFDWIEHCVERRNNSPQPNMATGGRVECDKDGLLVAFCFALSLVGRRALGAAAHNRHSSAAESFLYGLHSLFKGDFRITSTRDEWVFADMDILRCIIAPAVRMALKLHQDHFTAPDDFEEPPSLFQRITGHESTLFISHEHDPAWRQAILANTPSLLALRHVFDDGNDDYKVIMLNRRHLTFRVIKLNKECVRSFWSGQQQELIFLRNRNPERGSIQNARQVLRNMINSSADQPIGYPIYVSPLTTSFVESHYQLTKITGPPFTLELLRRGALSLWHWLTAHCGMSGSSNLSVPPLQQVVIASTQPRQRSAVRTEAPLACPEATHPAGPESSDEPVLTQRSSCTFPPNSTRSPLSEALQRSYSQPVRRRSDPNLEGSRRCRLAEMEGSTSAIRTEIDEGSGQDSLVILGADGRVRVSLHKENSPAHTSLPESLLERVKLRDVTQMFDRLNEPLGATGQPVVVWPLEDWRKKGGKSGWGEWRPENGLLGSVVHKWTPSNPVAAHRSHIGLVIMLVRMDDGEHFVPISEAAVDVLEV